MKGQVVAGLFGLLVGLLALAIYAGMPVFNYHHKVYSNSRTTEIEGGKFNFFFDNKFHSVCYTYRDNDTHQLTMACVKVADTIFYNAGAGKTL